MASPQRPLGSGFGPETTAAEALAGIDLGGKLFVVTGGASGIGIENVRSFTGAGATVVVPARRPDHARVALAGIDRVEVDELDLADLASVHAFADRFLASGRLIDVLVNNAGVMGNPETRVGRGWESQFATNHVGHFALTNRLWPALANGGARIVSVTSGGHRVSPIRWEDTQFERGYDKWMAYGQSKTANSLFAVELDRLAAAHAVRAFAVAPGRVRTALWRHLLPEDVYEPVDEKGNPTFPWKTSEQGAATSAWAAASPQLEGVGGVYLEDCDIAELADPDADTRDPSRQRGVYWWAIDPEQARRLWRMSADLTGIDAFAGASASPRRSIR